MIPFETITIFFSIAIMLAVVPGPDNIFVLTQSVLYGQKAALFITFGLCTGLLVHTTIVSLGVASVFQSSSLAFNILKLIGTAYLLYLAWGSFRSGAVKINQNKKLKLSWSSLYLRGVIMNITNPKVIVFF